MHADDAVRTLMSLRRHQSCTELGRSPVPPRRRLNYRLGSLLASSDGLHYVDSHGTCATRESADPRHKGVSHEISVCFKRPRATLASRGVSWLAPLPHRVSDLTYLVKRRAKDSEVLAEAYALAKRRSELFPFVGTDLAVEGFPRSANSFVLHALKWSNPEFKYASHMHACGPIKYAARKQIPMLVLIREPRSAVVSLALRDGLRMDYCFEWYLKYYRCVAAHRSSLVLAEFSTVTSGLDAIYEELRSRYGLALRQPPMEASEIAQVKEMVVHSHRRFFRGAFNPLAVGIPTQEKRDAAPEVEKDIDGSRRLSVLLQSCDRQYHELTGLGH